MKELQKPDWLKTQTEHSISGLTTWRHLVVNNISSSTAEPINDWHSFIHSAIRVDEKLGLIDSLIHNQLIDSFHDCVDKTRQTKTKKQRIKQK